MKGKIKESQSGIDKRVVRERLAERDVEGQRRLLRARQVVARPQDAREDAHHFLAPRLEPGDDDADARAAFFQARTRPFGGAFQLFFCRREGRTEGRTLDCFRLDLDELEMPQEFRGLGRQEVEGVGDQQLRLLQLVEQAGDEVGQARGIDVAEGFFLILLCPF